MVKLMRLLERFKSEPPVMLDVAIVMAEGDVLACVMQKDVYFRLSENWTRAIAQKAFGPMAGYYWMEVGGKPTNHGLLLTNIVSLTGVPITQTESTK